jgi:hypothetical protein
LPQPVVDCPQYLIAKFPAELVLDNLTQILFRVRKNQGNAIHRICVELFI